MAEHPRLVLRNFLSLPICKELEFIHKSCCTVGYRPSVFSTTLSHLIVTNCAHFIMPLVTIRERLKETVEEHFGCEYELFVEFTGLISWCKGASIGWHSDDNRDYLKQREFAAVCYLNSYGVDFNGGLFHFRDGEPSTIAPMAGDTIIYTADSKNIHSVSEITEGERVTLTLWFTRDVSHDEDVKIVSLLSENLTSSSMSATASYFPTLGSHNMYWFPPEEASRFQSGFDICAARLHVVGFNFVSSSEEHCLSMDPSDSLKLLKEPLHLSHGDELLALEFVNILHALQVVQFYYWKESGIEVVEPNGSSAMAAPPELDSPLNIMPLSALQMKKINSLKAVLLKDCGLAKTFLVPVSGKHSQKSIDWFRFCVVVSEWEAYSLSLLKELVTSLPYWITHKSIFSAFNPD